MCPKFPQMLFLTSMTSSLKSYDIITSLMTSLPKWCHYHLKVMTSSRYWWHHYLSDDMIITQVMLIGDSSVGKTCLLVRFKDGAFLACSYISTVGIDFRVINIYRTCRKKADSDLVVIFLYIFIYKTTVQKCCIMISSCFNGLNGK